MALEALNSPTSQHPPLFTLKGLKRKRSKRPRLDHDHSSLSPSSQDEYLALCLIMLARNGDPSIFTSQENSKLSTTAACYNCTVCNKTFTSYQALGGHKASHRKPNEQQPLTSTENNNKSTSTHECSVCHKSFSSGQALGGHKRRHFEGIIGGHIINHHQHHAAHKILDLDLNLPALPDFDSTSSFLVSADSPLTLKKPLKSEHH